MKTFYNLLLLSGLLLLGTGRLAAQCTTASYGLYPSATFTPICNGTPVAVTTLGYAGEYSNVAVTSGTTYTFTSSFSTDYITIAGSTGSPVYAYGTTPVTWTATTSGTVRFYTHTNAACGESSTSRTRAVSCSGGGGGGGGGCTSASYGLYPSSTYTPTCTGSPGTITTLGYAGEYSNVAVTSGTSYTFSSSVGTDYITIAGSTGSPVYAYGTTPVTWTATTTGTVRFYTHTNSACGESSTSRTRAVTCGTIVIYDPCASITSMSCGTAVTASSTGTGAWDVVSCGFSTPGQEKIYSFTPTTTGMHTLVVTSATGGYADYFFKQASLGCNASNWTCIDDLSGAASVSFGPLTAGTTYYILYDPESTSTITHTFRIDCPVAACNAPGTPSASNITPTSATLSWSAAGGAISYDWSVGTGASCPNGSTTNTTATSVNLTNLTPGTTYTFCVRTSTCGGGGPSSYVSTTFTTAPAANDNCAGAPTVTCGSTITGNTNGASSDAAVGSCGSAGAPGNGVWYKLVGNGAQVTLSLCGSSYNTKLHVFSGACGDLNCIGSNDDFCGLQSQVVFNASVGTEYYIVVSGSGAATGAFSMSITCACGPNIGAPWTLTNIGSATGSGINNVCDGTIDIQSTGYGSPTADVQTYAWQQMCGNGFIKAKLENVTNGGWGGLMFRESNAPGSKKVALRSQLTNAVVRDLRAATNGVMQQQMFPRPNAPQWLRLTRNGNVFTGEVSLDGVNWDWVFATNLVLPNCIEVGLFTQSINVNANVTAVFSNIMGVPLNAPIPLVEAGNDGPQDAIRMGLFPNPAQHEVNVKLESFIGKKVSLVVYNSLGQAVLVRDIDEVQDATERLSLNGLSNGVYYVTLRADNTPVQTEKLIIGALRP